MSNCDWVLVRLQENRSGSRKLATGLEAEWKSATGDITPMVANADQIATRLTEKEAADAGCERIVQDK